jgi:nucleotide-binding universal stress UspA family protein
MTINTILCPTDLSDASRHALEHAAAIAKWSGARLVAMHVQNVVFDPVPALVGAGERYDASSVVAPAAQALRQHVAQAVASDLGVPVDVVVQAHAGHTAPAIAAYAASLPADLVVVGTHGRSGLSHLMLGSVAEKVLRQTACPVLTVPPRVRRASTLPYKRLLWATDFSAASTASLPAAFSFAREAKAEITLLHVVEDPNAHDLFVAHSYDVHEHAARAEQHAYFELLRLIPDAAHYWSSPTIRVVRGTPGEAIVEATLEEGTDLIVLGVPARTPLDVMVFGSTTNTVLRNASCPVLTVRTVD